MDTIVSEELAKAMLKLIEAKQKGICFKFNRRVLDNKNHEKHNHPHPAVCLLRKTDYWDVGGCDEDLVGHYGQTDPIFWHRAIGKLKVHTEKKLYLDYMPDGEANINRNTSYNAKLFKYKKRINNWSTNFVRFKWKRVL